VRPRTLTAPQGYSTVSTYSECYVPLLDPGSVWGLVREPTAQRLTQPARTLVSLTLCSVDVSDPDS